jgi:hypothetical protein
MSQVDTHHISFSTQASVGELNPQFQLILSVGQMCSGMNLNQAQGAKQTTRPQFAIKTVLARPAPRCGRNHSGDHGRKGTAGMILDSPTFLASLALHSGSKVKPGCPAMRGPRVV